MHSGRSAKVAEDLDLPQQCAAFLGNPLYPDQAHEAQGAGVVITARLMSSFSRAFAICFTIQGYTIKGVQRLLRRKQRTVHHRIGQW
ncbi:Uncharacterised protein [Brucella melitensis]|nr:Uncharacterised protein [Brucella melitensis]